MKKHLALTIFAGLSFLLFLFFLGGWLMTMSGKWKIPLGQDQYHERSISFNYGDLVYDSMLKDMSRAKQLQPQNEYGFNIQRFTASANPKTGEGEQAAYSLGMPATYPIVVFAILPLAWVIAIFTSRKDRKEEAPAEKAATP